MKRVLEVEDVLKENFEVTCFGTPRLLLSIQISWFENRVTLCQELYILKILDKYKMSDRKPSPTPMDCGAKPQAARAEDEKTDKTEYQSKIGSLLYLAAGTRPDIMFAVNALSQFSSNPTKVHLNMVIHIFRYLKGSARKTEKCCCFIYRSGIYGFISRLQAGDVDVILGERFENKNMPFVVM
ncbi:hypothetical protein JTB14_028445 [Gonioctena quinquepunctata]|nr:hypothetical protein JTB14_028445 [Gonioctena quinquepunctata]